LSFSAPRLVMGMVAMISLLAKKQKPDSGVRQVTSLAAR
jgi:hypothetical protein